MKKQFTGWVVVQYVDGKPDDILHWTFTFLRKDAIAEFIKGSAHDWNYWRKKSGYKCVKATQTTEICN